MGRMGAGPDHGELDPTCPAALRLEMLHQLAAAGKRMRCQCLTMSASGYSAVVMLFTLYKLVGAGKRMRYQCLTSSASGFSVAIMLLTLYQLVAAGKRIRSQCLNASASGYSVAVMLLTLHQLAAAGKRMRFQCLNASASGCPTVHAVPAGCNWEAFAMEKVWRPWTLPDCACALQPTQCRHTRENRWDAWGLGRPTVSWTPPALLLSGCKCCTSWLQLGSACVASA